MKAMVLAAGKGERMLPLTRNTPKPLLEVKGKKLIEHTIENLRRAGFTDLVINTAYLGEMIESCLGDGASYGVRIVYSREEEPLETGGGIAKALPLLTEGGEQPFLLVNADIWTDYDFRQLKDVLNTDDGERMLAHLVLIENPEHHQTGDFACKQGCVFLSGSHGKDENETDIYTYSGIAVIDPVLVASYASDNSAFPLRPVLEQAIRSGQVSGEVYSGIWVDVGTPARLDSLNK